MCLEQFLQLGGGGGGIGALRPRAFIVNSLLQSLADAVGEASGVLVFGVALARFQAAFPIFERDDFGTRAYSLTPGGMTKALLANV